MDYKDIDETCKMIVNYYYKIRLFRNPTDYEDLLQECRIEALRVLKLYDPNNSASEKTFLVSCLKHKLSNIFQKNRTYSKYHVKNLLFDNSDYSTIPLTNGDINIILDNCFTDSSYHLRLKRLLTLLLEGYTQTEISKQWNISRQRIEQLVRGIEKLLKAKGAI